MRREVRQKSAGSRIHAADLFRVRFGESCFADLAHPQLDRRNRVLELREELGAWYIPVGELGVAVAHRAVLAEDIADEVLEIAGEMKREVAARVGDAGGNLPEI